MANNILSESNSQKNQNLFKKLGKSDSSGSLQAKPARFQTNNSKFRSSSCLKSNKRGWNCESLFGSANGNPKAAHPKKNNQIVWNSGKFGAIKENFSQEDLEDWKDICVRKEREIISLKEDLSKFKNENSDIRLAYCKVMQEFLKVKSELAVQAQNLPSPDHQNGHNCQNGQNGTLLTDPKTIEEINGWFSDKMTMRRNLKLKDNYITELERELQSLLSVSAKENELLLEKSKQIDSLKTRLDHQIVNAESRQVSPSKVADLDCSPDGHRNIIFPSFMDATRKKSERDQSSKPNCQEFSSEKQMLIAEIEEILESPLRNRTLGNNNDSPVKDRKFSSYNGESEINLEVCQTFDVD